MNNPKISIITPTYKSDLKMIKRCIDCVRLQDLTSWEYIICSDGVEEIGVKDLIQSLNDKRIQYYFTPIKTQTNDYGANVRYEMSTIARGKYMVLIDDDNIVLPNYLSSMYNVLENKDVKADFVICDIVHFGPLNAKITGPAPQIVKGVPVIPGNIDTLQVMFKAKVIKQIPWALNAGYIQDGITFERWSKKFKYAKLDMVLGFHM